MACWLHKILTGLTELPITRDLSPSIKSDKGRTIRKVMGGMGKKPKKQFMQGKMPRKKIRAKKKGKKKIHAEGRSNCDFYFICKICQKAC